MHDKLCAATFVTSQGRALYGVPVLTATAGVAATGSFVAWAGLDRPRSKPPPLFEHQPLGQGEGQGQRGREHASRRAGVAREPTMARDEQAAEQLQDQQALEQPELGVAPAACKRPAGCREEHLEAIDEADLRGDAHGQADGQGQFITMRLLKELEEVEDEADRNVLQDKSLHRRDVPEVCCARGRARQQGAATERHRCPEALWVGLLQYQQDILRCAP
mmetsp:Transcript_116930/g.325892  ORF Transcript_116930/g.325892 Transcript_116930/m.325892 type:complete len:219 (-) Transcript_116930:462-1118(-)